jgi:hypothetical protein
MRALKERKYWFWARLIEMTVQKDHIADPNATCEVWKNLVLLEATGEVEAISKAMSRGKAEEGDCEGTLMLGGEPATTVFVGVENMGVIHDPLEDGAEILWELEKCHVSEVTSIVRRRSALLRSLKKELRSV